MTSALEKLDEFIVVYRAELERVSSETNNEKAEEVYFSFPEYACNNCGRHDKIQLLDAPQYRSADEGHTQKYKCAYCKNKVSTRNM